MLNRPKALNPALFGEPKEALRLIDADEGICAIVIAGSKKVFAGKRLALVSRCVADAFADGRTKKKLVLISRTSHESAVNGLV